MWKNDNYLKDRKREKKKDCREIYRKNINIYKDIYEEEIVKRRMRESINLY